MNSLNLLFVCSKNKWRSPTAEKLYRGVDLIHVRSRGTSSSARSTLRQADVEWADLIFVMEQKHKQRIKSEFNQFIDNKKIVVLDIPDDYQYMDPELIDLIKDSVDPILSVYKDA